MDRTVNRHYIKNIIPLLILLICVVIAFMRFMGDNRERITNQNEVYLEDLTVQSAAMIDNLLSENVRYIRATAFLFGSTADLDDPDSDVIEGFEGSTVFERLRFIDRNGNDYTSGGIAANVADREYFKAGMKGKTGVTYVINSRVTNETQIGFYSPVYNDGEIMGIMVGFYGEDYIRDLLEFELFGIEGEAWLCLPDGTVLGTTADDKVDNYLVAMGQEGICSEDELKRITAAFVGKQNTLYNYNDNGKSVTGYIANLESSDWALVKLFPPQAAKRMLVNANREGVELLLILAALFIAYAVFLVQRFLRQRRRMEEEARNANDISTGVSRLFEKFQTVDFKDGSYSYIYGVPDDNKLGLRGRYEDFRKALLARIKDGSERAEAADFLRLDNLRRLFSDGTDRLSLRIHAPLNDDEWFTYNFVALERERDEIRQMLIIRQNVTELHAKEEQAQEILKKAYADAESANRAKSNFLSSMSHDIRTPMNAIIGFTNIAKGHIDEKERVVDCLDKIGSSSSHLLSLINDILDMSKIESGKIQLRVEGNDLSEVVNNLTDMVRSQIMSKKLTLETDISGITHKNVYLDGLRLNQVLLNILSNAIKYTPAGGKIFIKLTETRTGVPDMSSYLISVRDTGIGMSKEYLPYVFDSFTRERTSTVDKIQGTGLGMAIAHRIVALMNGTIDVESELGAGTEFTIRLPLRYYTPKAPAADKTGIKKEEKTVSFAGERILLVEDNDINAQIASFVLKEHGFIVDRCENGQLAVDKLRETGPAHYAAVLMDIQMPVMDGYEASATIRALDNADYSSLPIIAMTANSFDDDKKHAYAAGMDAHVSKPFDVDELMGTLSKLIHK